MSNDVANIGSANRALSTMVRNEAPFCAACPYDGKKIADRIENRRACAYYDFETDGRCYFHVTNQPIPDLSQPGNQLELAIRLQTQIAQYLETNLRMQVACGNAGAIKTVDRIARLIRDIMDRNERIWVEQQRAKREKELHVENEGQMLLNGVIRPANRTATASQRLVETFSSDPRYRDALRIFLTEIKGLDDDVAVLSDDNSMFQSTHATLDAL